MYRLFFVLALSSPVLCDSKINDNDNDNEMTITMIIILIMIMIMISIHSTFLKDSYSYTLLNNFKNGMKIIMFFRIAPKVHITKHFSYLI